MTAPDEHAERLARWLPVAARPRTSGPECPACHLPMLCGQRGGHAECVGMDLAFPGHVARTRK